MLTVVNLLLAFAILIIVTRRQSASSARPVYTTRRRMRTHDHQKLHYAFLTGLAIGAVAAAVYAPQSGAATRKRIGEAIEDAGTSLSAAGEYLQVHANRFNAQAQATLAHTHAQVQEVLEQAGTALNTTLKQAQEAFADGSSQASDAIKTAITTATGQPLR